MKVHSQYECPNCHEVFTFELTPELTIAFEAAERRTGKPSLVMFTCVHCPVNLLIEPSTGAVRTFTDDMGEDFRARLAQRIPGEHAESCGYIDLGHFERLRDQTAQFIEEGHRRKQQGDVRGALAKYEALLEVRKHDPDGWYNKGLCLSSLGDLVGAEAAFRHSAKFNADFVQAWSNLGMVQLQLGLHGEAETSFDKAIAVDPSYAKAYVGKGNCAMLRGDLSSARQAFLLALERDPNNAVAKAALRNLDNRCGGNTAPGVNEQEMQRKLAAVIAEFKSNPQQVAEVCMRVKREDPELWQTLLRLMPQHK